jgi:hypothetical protein
MFGEAPYEPRHKTPDLIKPSNSSSYERYTPNPKGMSLIWDPQTFLNSPLWRYEPLSKTQTEIIYMGKLPKFIQQAYKLHFNAY